MSGRSPLIAGPIVALAVLLALSADLAWGSIHAGSVETVDTLTDVPVASLALGLAVAAIIGGALIALAGWPAGFLIAGVIATAVALVTGAFLLASETVAVLLPAELIPVSARRLTLAAGAGAGAWLAFGTAAAIALVSFERTRERLLDAADDVRAHGAVPAAALAGLAVGVVALVQLRQQPWLRSEAFHASFAIDGVALPGISAATLAAVWLLAAGVTLGLVDRWRIGALLAAAAGCLTAAAAATTIALTDAVASVNLTSARVGSAVWATCALGLAIAATAAALLRQSRDAAPRAAAPDLVSYEWDAL